MADLIWTSSNERPGRVGLPAYLAGTPLAVFAGFDLASAIVVVSQRPNPDTHGYLASWSCGLFLLAVVLLLTSLGRSWHAQSVDIAPDQALAWWPETRLSETQLETTRQLVWASQKVAKDQLEKAQFWWILALWVTALSVGTGVTSYGASIGRILASLVLPLGLIFVTILFRRSETLQNAPSTDMTTLSSEAKSLILRAEDK